MTRLNSASGYPKACLSCGHPEHSRPGPCGVIDGVGCWCVETTEHVRTLADDLFAIKTTDYWPAEDVHMAVLSSALCRSVVGPLTGSEEAVTCADCIRMRRGATR